MYLKKQVKIGILTLSRRRQKNKKGCEIDSDDDDLNSIDEGSVLSTASTDTTFLDDDLNSGSLHITCLRRSSSSNHSALSNRSDYDSFNSSLGFGSNHSIRSKSTSSKGTKKVSLKRKNVSFNDSNIKWIMVESYKGYSADIWWSKEEIKQRQFDMRKVLFEYSPDELFKIGKYTTAYHNARHQSVISKHHNNKISMDKSKVNLSNDDYKMIVRGKSNGWDGLEKVLSLSPSSASNNKNFMTRQKIVRKIVNAQYDKSGCHIDNHQISNDLANTIRSLSKSLTTSDRSWAVVMGKADRDALSR